MSELAFAHAGPTEVRPLRRATREARSMAGPSLQLVTTPNVRALTSAEVEYVSGGLSFSEAADIIGVAAGLGAATGLVLGFAGGGPVGAAAGAGVGAIVGTAIGGLGVALYWGMEGLFWCLDQAIEGLYWLWAQAGGC